MPTPLDGIQVLDASSGIAGPMAGMLLADFGADVVKVEGPDGDPTRAEPGFAVWNRNKRGITVDLSTPGERERLLSLLRGADLCIFSAPLEELTALGFDPASVTASNPSLVFLHTPPFTGFTPWAGAAESAALVSAATGIAVAQYGYNDVPIETIYPYVLYAQAIWAATSGMAALIEREESGHGQTVMVGGLHGMMLAMSGQITHQPGAQHAAQPGGPGGPIPFYRVYQCGDGQSLFMATLTPKFFTAAFDELGVLDLLADERLGGEPNAMALPENAPWVIERIQAAFDTRERDEVLDKLRAAGCPVAPVGDRDDWLDHEQLRAIGLRAEVDDPERGRVVMPAISLNLTRTPGAVRSPAPTLGQHNAEVSPAEGRPAPAGNAAAKPGALHGRRVLDLGSVIAGTYAASLLAELGADVIKVEAPSGDLLRMFAPTFFGYNKGKRSIVIDLRTDAGRDVFYELIKSADVVIDNYRPGVLQRLKVDYDSLVRVNPDIITVSVTGFGEGGPIDDYPGWDPMLQAWSGMMQAQGGEGNPVFYTLPVNDISSASMVAFGACLAIFHRERAHEGQRVWTSLAGQGAIMQIAELLRFNDRTPAPRGGRDYQGPSPLDRFYRTRDGWIRMQANRDGALTALQSADILPADAPTDDDGLTHALTEAFGKLSSEKAVDYLTAMGIPVVQALSLQELSTDPRFGSTEVVHLHTPQGGAAVYSAGRYARFSRTEQTAVLYPPGLGEHTDEILQEAGLDAAAIDKLKAEGVVAQNGPLLLPEQ
ncbi:MAG: CoA transferase [Dehalococcoidia bacterium]